MSHIGFSSSLGGRNFTSENNYPNANYNSVKNRDNATRFEDKRYSGFNYSLNNTMPQRYEELCQRSNSGERVAK